jgi:DNA-binding winged helix-turn-helix (wHTH) protein
MGGVLRFGPFELDVAAYELRRDEKRVPLENRPMDLLVLLAQRAGTLVDRGTIQHAIGEAGVFLDWDAAINTAVRKIRRALGDDVGEPRFIETIVGKGYRFVAPVARVEPWRPEAGPTWLVTQGFREFPLAAGDNLIGRDAAVRVRLGHPSVSRRHARIRVGGARAVVDDLGSCNGTFVDGRRIESHIGCELRNGTILGIGAVTLQVLALESCASTTPLRSKP